MHLLIRILSSHHHLLPPCVNSRRFRTAMDEWQFSPHSTSEAGQRHRVPDTSASTVGVMQSFTFPGTSDPGFSTDISHLTPLLPADLFPGVEQSGFFSALNSRDSELFALPQAPEQMSTQWDDPAVQPDWDNLVSSLQSAQTRPPSTDSSAADFFYDGYGIDLLTGDMHRSSDEYSISRFPSAPPSSIPIPILARIDPRRLYLVPPSPPPPLCSLYIWSSNTAACLSLNSTSSSSSSSQPFFIVVVVAFSVHCLWALWLVCLVVAISLCFALFIAVTSPCRRRHPTLSLVVVGITCLSAFVFVRGLCRCRHHLFGLWSSSSPSHSSPSSSALSLSLLLSVGQACGMRRQMAQMSEDMHGNQGGCWGKCPKTCMGIKVVVGANVRKPAWESRWLVPSSQPLLFLVVVVAVSLVEFVTVPSSHTLTYPIILHPSPLLPSASLPPPLPGHRASVRHGHFIVKEDSEDAAPVVEMALTTQKLWNAWGLDLLEPSVNVISAANEEKLVADDNEIAVDPCFDGAASNINDPPLAAINVDSNHFARDLSKVNFYPSRSPVHQR
ncbi:hypothetical protein B0H13DRAFT_2359396 [Mycena leptocephala]|nr:hypothetical protein B0H13DRAFT_2359396 [Mycena leptocephala]